MPDDKRFADLETRMLQLEAFIRRPPWNVDPSPDDWGRVPVFGGWLGWRGPIPVPQPGDPGPMDISRLSKAQLELSLESIKAQRVRLDATERMIKEQLKQG
jgi:hypothetical protein